MATSILKADLIVATHGTWSRDATGAWLGCPHTCLMYTHIEAGAIAANGDVTPSFDCPNCDYDELITLTDWEE